MDRLIGTIELRNIKAHGFPVDVELMLTVNSLSAAQTTFFQICRQKVNTMFCLTKRQIQEALLSPVYSRRLLKGLLWFLGPNSAPSSAHTKQVICVLFVQLLKTFTYCIQNL